MRKMREIIGFTDGDSILAPGKYLYLLTEQKPLLAIIPHFYSSLGAIRTHNSILLPLHRESK